MANRPLRILTEDELAKFRPMLASPAEEMKFPVLASPKIDGVRGVVRGGKLLTRKLLAVPNRHVFEILSQPELEGLDGELVVGPANAPDVMRKTTSGLMARDGEPQFMFWVFDLFNREGRFERRHDTLEKVATLYMRNKCSIQILPHKLINNADELLEFEQRMVAHGYEGVITRDPKAPYKFGRSTAREGYMLKIKRFADSEALIIGFEEEQENTNAATKNELGLTKRSTAKAGKVGKGTLGAFVCRDLTSGVEFTVGGGITAADRAAFWNQREGLEGKILKYKFFPVGVKQAPRHPVFLGFRDARDL